MAELIRKFLFPLFLLIILLDLNEFVTRNLGTEAVLTNAILGLSFFFFLFSRRKYSYNNRPHRSFLLAFFTFCFVGAISSIMGNGTTVLTKEIRYYVPSFIIYIVAFRVIISQTSKEHFVNIIHYISILIGVNGIFILISIFFNYDFHDGVTSSIDRAVGLYSNANRAGYVSALGQAFAVFMILGEHKRKRGIYFLIYFITLIAALSTFSKGASAVSIILALRLIYFISRNHESNWSMYRKHGRVLVLFLAFAIFSLVANFKTLKVNLSEEQMFRLTTFELLLKGNINEETTSHRSEIGTYALDKIMERPIFGYGLGEFHRMDIGYGTHNIYLLIWGESGIIGILAYISFLLVWFLAMKNNSNPAFKLLAINILIVFVFSGFAAHTLLSNKPYLLILGVLFGGMSVYSETDKLKKTYDNRTKQEF